MDKGFGIAALLLAITAVSVPFFGIYVSTFAILLAIVAALAGERVFSTATSLIAGINTLFLSPAIWAAIKGSEATTLTMVTLAAVAAPFVAMMFGKTPTTET
jgi:hypothetical protein